MKQTLLLCLMLLLGFSSVQAQQEAINNQVDNTIASGTDSLKQAKQIMPDTMPKFPGGEQAMLRFIGKNTRYPAAAQRAGIQGIVLLSLTIAADGTIEDVKVITSQGKALDNESIRVVKLMPKWEPALSDSMPVAASFVVPVQYRIVQQPQQQQRLHAPGH